VVDCVRYISNKGCDVGVSHQGIVLRDCAADNTLYLALLLLELLLN
jgi:hypothetical protein